MGEGLLTIFFQAWQVHYSPDLVGTMAATLTLHTTGPVDINQGLWRGSKDPTLPNWIIGSWLILGKGIVFSCIHINEPTKLHRLESNLWSQGQPS